MEDINIVLEKAISLNKDKKWKNVSDLLPNSLLIDYNNADLYIEKARSLWNLRNFSECELAAQKALEIDESNSRALCFLGHVNCENKDYVLAEECYKKALAIDPNSSVAYNGLGNIFKVRKESDIAEVYYKKAIENNSSIAIPYNGLGTLYFELKNFVLAEEYFKKALEINPDLSLSYNGLGGIASQKEDYISAEEYYKKAISLDPNYPAPYYNLGLNYKSLKEDILAEEYFKKAIEINEKYVFAYNSLGILYKTSNKYKLAEEYYKKAIEIDPHYDSPCYNLGLLYNENDNILEAKKSFEQYLNNAKNKDSFLYRSALSKIDEIHKKIENSSYKKISNIINQIKKLLLFNEDCISHYTGLTTVQFLLLKDSPFRLSEGTFLNDTSEGEELFKFLKDSGVIRNQNHVEIFAKRPFIGSFVDANKNNDLTLWRMYGKEGLEEAKGCSITINIKEFKAEIKNKINQNGDINSSTNNDVEFYRVIYRNGKDFCFSGASIEINYNLTKLMNNLKLEHDKFYKKKNLQKNEELEIIELLNEIAYLFKSVEYQYENEIRLVINEGVGFDKKIDFNVDNFAPSYNPIKVYIELVPIASLLKTITIGPKVDKAEEWASTFHYFLANKELKPEIYISKLPFK